MHRDLKPENFLFANKKETAALKAIDFGLSVFFKPGMLLVLLYEIFSVIYVVFAKVSFCSQGRDSQRLWGVLITWLRRF